MNTIYYKGFKIECTINQAVAFLNNSPIFGTFASDSEILSAYEKMIIKIDKSIKNK